jgi:hypothetical protein
MSSTLTSTAPLISIADRPRPVVPFAPFARVTGRTAIWAVLLGIGLVTPVSVFSGLLSLPEIGSGVAAAQQRWLAYVLNPVAVALKALLVAPILEELFYRGLVLQLLRRYCPLWVAVLISSAFFGITHIGHGWANVVGAFALGGVFAWLVVRTRSLLSSMLCHAVVNFTWLFLVVPAFGLLDRIVHLDVSKPVADVNALTLFPAWWLVVSIVLAGAAFRMLRKDNPRSTSA